MNGLTRYLQSHAQQPALVGLVLGLSLTGCMGQKPSIPTFGWNQSKQTPADNVGAEESAEQAAPEPEGLANVALNDPADLNATDLEQARLYGLPSAGEQIQMTSGTAQRIADPVAGQGPASQMDDLDAFFQAQQPTSGHAPVQSASEQAADESFANYVAAVDSIEQGQSNLEALKNSLTNLQQSLPQQGSQTPGPQLGLPNDILAQAPVSNAPVNHSAAPELPVDFQPQSMADISQFSSDAANSAGVSSLNPAASPDPAAPWGLNTPTTQAVTAAGVNAMDRVRTMLANSSTLIQQNNLRAAQALAESARVLMTKTQSALSPGEVTPDQILAEIQVRQQQYQQQFGSATPTNAEPTVDMQHAGPAVVIDLSREFVNGPKVGREANGITEVEKFAQAAVLANQAASLPTITPREFDYSTSYSEPVDASEGNVNSAPAAQSERFVPDYQQTAMNVVPLGQLPVDQFAAPYQTTADETEAETSSIPPILMLSPAGDSLGQAADANQGPALLMAPGGLQTADADAETDTEVDPFAAAFADVTETTAPTIDEAPSMVDEATLELPAKSTSVLAGRSWMMVMGGIVMATLLLFRWRR